MTERLLVLGLGIAAAFGSVSFGLDMLSKASERYWAPIERLARAFLVIAFLGLLCAAVSTMALTITGVVGGPW